VLTHFSQRYAELDQLGQEAQQWFPDVVVARDLCTIPVPHRRATS
jgi:ribonuclease BN (tRNA processing enzyme)